MLYVPSNIPLYGDTSFRGKCHLEEVEQASIIGKIRRGYPLSFGAIIFHPRNEGRKIGGQFSQVIKENAEGMTKGAADVVIPAGVSFVCEVKRLDMTKSKLSTEQIDYLTAAQYLGAFACVALGAVGALEAFNAYLAKHYPTALTGS